MRPVFGALLGCWQSNFVRLFVEAVASMRMYVRHIFVFFVLSVFAIFFESILRREYTQTAKSLLRVIESVI